MKPKRRRTILRPTEIADRVSFTCPDCNAVHTFKVVSPFECVSLSDEDTYRVEDQNESLPVLFPLFICTKPTCNFEAVLSLDTES